MKMHANARQGFTLIELSIVLVIIGLIVGGVLVGQDLIRAASVRATVTQIEKYNSAANTFRGKYGYLPGDIKDPEASSFGFMARGAGAGRGDGNGLLWGYNGAGAAGNVEETGETTVFWVDLSDANLIDGTFDTANFVLNTSSITGTAINQYFPLAKIGRGNSIYVWGGGSWNGSSWQTNGYNYYGMSVISNLQIELYSSPGLTVTEAYLIDQKVDDGLPQSGNVLAQYMNYNTVTSRAEWASGGGVEGAQISGGPSTAATPGSSATCYDNSTTANGTPGVAGVTQHYSVEISNGSNVNCALSFKMQAGD